LDFSILSEQIASQDIIEWIGLITGIIYVVLASYERPSCWIFGIISSAAIAFKSFDDYKLIADGILQVFYVVIGFLGLWNWLKGRVGDVQKPIVVSPITHHAIAIGICLVVSIPVSWLLIRYAAARFGYIDTLITIGSIWATILLVRKDLHNWIYWIVLDFMLIFLYYVSQAYLFSLLFLIYTLIAFWGFRVWRANIFRKHSQGQLIN